MKTYNAYVKNGDGEIVTISIEADSLEGVKNKCSELGFDVIGITADSNIDIEKPADAPIKNSKNSSTKYILIILVTGALFSSFWSVSSALTKDRLIGAFTFFQADRKCFNYHKSNNYFKNPDSAYIVSSILLTKENNRRELKQNYPHIFSEDYHYPGIVELEVSAMNSMGGYASSKVNCPIPSIWSTSEYMISYMARYRINQLWFERNWKLAEISDKKWTVDNLNTRGEIVYFNNCESCHMEDGSGLQGIFPAIKGSPVITGDINTQIDIMMNGKGMMPAFGTMLSAVDFAAVVTYTRNDLGHSTKYSVQPKEIEVLMKNRLKK